MAINLKKIMELGSAIPLAIFAHADEVIEESSHVRFGSKADTTDLPAYVRRHPESRHPFKAGHGPLRATSRHPGSLVTDSKSAMNGSDDDPH